VPPPAPVPPPELPTTPQFCRHDPWREKTDLNQQEKPEAQSESWLQELAPPGKPELVLGSTHS
jgi:hypothetical protein